MADTKPKTIDYDTYLKALALFTVANQAYVRAREMQFEMDKLLGVGDGSWPGEVLYRDKLASCGDFDKALSNEGITVEPRP